MKLHFSRQGQGPALLLLHGLFGSGDNFLPVARLLGSHFDVILPDLRNHGRSPHDPLMPFSAMAQDILELMDSLGLPKAHVLGHSLGAKAAMRLALDSSAKVEKLVLADMAPKAYGPLFPHVFEALEGLDLAAMPSRGEAELALGKKIPDTATRLLMLKNIGRDEAGKFYWKMNIAVLSAARLELSQAIEPGPQAFSGPVLVLRGGASDYVTDEDLPFFKTLFPALKMTTLAGLGHWLHAQDPQAFSQAVKDFLLEPQP